MHDTGLRRWFRKVQQNKWGICGRDAFPIGGCAFIFAGIRTVPYNIRFFEYDRGMILCGIGALTIALWGVWRLWRWKYPPPPWAKTAEEERLGQLVQYYALWSLALFVIYYPLVAGVDLLS